MHKNGLPLYREGWLSPVFGFVLFFFLHPLRKQKVGWRMELCQMEMSGNFKATKPKPIFCSNIVPGIIFSLFPYFVSVAVCITWTLAENRISHLQMEKRKEARLNIR